MRLVILNLMCLVMIGIGFTISQSRTTFAQPTTAVISQPRLKIEGALDAKSQKLNNGNYLQIHTFEGKAGERLTVDLKSKEFDPWVIVLRPDQKELSGETGLK
jgi:hypothetical protein